MKRFCYFLRIVVLLSIALFTSSLAMSHAAHAASTTAKFPQASGMGCITDNTSVYELQIGSCLGYSNGRLRPDAYITFRIRPGHSGIRDCEYTISLIDNSSGDIITDTGTQDCTSYARNAANNVHFYGVNYQNGNGVYHTFLSVTTHYNDNTAIANALSSPEVTVP